MLRYRLTLIGTESVLPEKCGKFPFKLPNILREKKSANNRIEFEFLVIDFCALTMHLQVTVAKPESCRSYLALASDDLR